MKTLHSLQEIPVTKELVLREAEKSLFHKFERKKIRTAWQLRQAVAGLGALGVALQATATYAVILTLIKGTWVPRSWA